MTTASKTAKKAPVTITAPKITSAWLKVVATSNAGEVKTIEAIENLSAAMVLESRLSVRDIKKVITASKKSCGMISVGHVEALPTWSKLRTLHADFKALPLAKQLSTASASYSLLGAGNGEQIKSSVDAQGEKVTATENLQKAIASARKAKNSKSSTPKASTPKASKASNLDAIKAFTALVSSLDFTNLSDAEAEAFAMLQTIIEDKALVQA